MPVTELLRRMRGVWQSFPPSRFPLLRLSGSPPGRAWTRDCKSGLAMPSAALRASGTLAWSPESAWYTSAQARNSGRSLAVQWARHGVRVNTVAPGFFRSEITDGMYTDEHSLTWLRRNTPLPFQGNVDDFVGAVLWLVGDAGRYVTG